MKTAFNMNTKIVAFFALFIMTISANAQIEIQGHAEQRV